VEERRSGAIDARFDTGLEAIDARFEEIDSRLGFPSTTGTSC
jgi:hypothetical protein